MSPREGDPSFGIAPTTLEGTPSGEPVRDNLSLFSAPIVAGGRVEPLRDPDGLRDARREDRTIFVRIGRADSAR